MRLRWILAVGLCGVPLGAGPQPSPGLSVRDGVPVKDGKPYRGIGADFANDRAWMIERVAQANARLR